MKRILPALLFLACSAANAQFVTGQILTAAQLNAAFANVLSTSGGTLTGPLTVQGSTTLANLTVNGTFTVPGGFSLSSISPTGSTSGQVIASTGASSAPAWRNVSAAALTGILPVVNGGTGVTTAAAELSRIGAAPLAGASFTGPVSLSYSGPIFTLNDTSGTSKASLLFNKNGVTAWGWGNSSTPNALAVDRYVSGSYADSPISVANATGIVTMSDGVAGTPISGSTGAFTTLSASSTVSGAGFTSLLSPYLTTSTAASTYATIAQATTALAATGGSVNGVTQGLTTPAASKVTTLQATSAITPSTTAGIVGTTLGDNANAGGVGEYLAGGNTATIPNVTSTSVGTIGLSAGDWDVQAVASFTSSGTAMTQAYLGVGTVLNTLGALGTYTEFQTGSASAALQVMASPVTRINVSTSTTVYATGNVSFSAGTLTMTSVIRARRVR